MVKKKSKSISGIYEKAFVYKSDIYGRNLGVILDNLCQSTIEYDSATGRIKGVSMGNGSFLWDYLSGSSFKSKLRYPNGAMTTWSYETKSNFLSQITNIINGTIASQYCYVHDLIGRRISVAKTGSMVEEKTQPYDYNLRDELVFGQGENYTYDDLGNRLIAEKKNYISNELNQYISINDFIPQYDADGNQTLVKTSTGIWEVQYDAENRPVRWIQGEIVITMGFDRKGRRIEYIERHGQTIVNCERFVYDNNLCLQRLLGEGNEIYQCIVWDPTEPIATRPLFLHNVKEQSVLFYTYDGSKNVSEIFPTATPGEECIAHYDYGPFGQIKRVASSSEHGKDLAKSNPFRFSSEFANDTTGTIDYLFRSYNPLDGRWISRDLIGEEFGGVALYAFCANQYAVVDLLGLLDTSLPNYSKVDMSSQLGAATGVGAKVSIQVIEESAEHCCEDGSTATITELTLGGNLELSIGFSVTATILGTGVDIGFTFSSLDIDFATNHLIWDKCKGEELTDLRFDIANLMLNPGIKEITVGVGSMASVSVSLACTIEFLLGIEYTLGKIGWYGGIYVDYDIGVKGTFRWREYDIVNIDDLQPKHQRQTLVEF